MRDFVLLGVACSLWLFGGLRRRSGDAETFFGLWLGWTLLALVGARFVPAASYLLLLPLLLATGLELLLAQKLRSRADLLFAGPGLFTAVLILPHLALPLDLLGLAALPLIATLVCLVMAPAVPVMVGRARWVLTAAFGVLAAFALATGLQVPTFTPDDPQIGNIAHVQDESSGESSVTFTGYPLPAPLAQVADFGDRWSTPLAWAPRERGFRADAQGAGLQPPEVLILEVSDRGDAWVVRGRALSPRGAPILQWAFPADTAPGEVAFEGVVVPPDESKYALFDPEWRVFTIFTVPADGVAFELSYPPGHTPEFHLADRSYGLPEVSSEIAAARPAWSAPNGPGDATVVVRRFVVAAPGAGTAPGTAIATQSATASPEPE